jgi:hypothetical protein
MLSIGMDKDCNQESHNKLKAQYLSDLYVTVYKSKRSNLKESQYTNIFQGFKFSYNNQFSHFENPYKN